MLKQTNGEIGGLVGFQSFGTVTNGRNSTYVFGFGTVGGIVGYSVDNSRIINCTNSGYVDFF